MKITTRIRGLAMLATTLSASAWSASTVVRVEPLEAVQVPIEYSAAAEVISLNRAQISAEVRARILTIHVAEGTVVDPDQVVVELDCRDFQFAHQHAQANLDAARARRVWAQQQLQRARQLAATRNVAKEVFELRTSELATAEAELRARTIDVADRQLDVERCVIKSPFRAAVVERRGSIGELAEPGKPILTVQDLERVEVAAHILSRELPTLRKDAASTYMRHGAGRYPLTLLRVSPVIQALSGTREARFGFTGQQAPVGANGRIHWTSGPGGIPAHLIVNRKDALGVFLLENGKARFHLLPDAREGLPVKTGLPRSTLLITEGHHNLSDGDAVRISQ